MVDYLYLIVNARTGAVIDELSDLNVSSFSRMLSGVGSLQATLPITSAKATPANLLGPREITVLRDENATENVVWNGPMMPIAAPSRRGNGPITITAREPSYYFTRSYVENDKAYSAADVFTIVRDLVAERTGKTGGSLYGWTTTAGSAGHTKTWQFPGRARYDIGDTINGLAQDPSTSFDYRMDYATGATPRTAARTLTLGSPTLGTAQTAILTENMLHDYGFSGVEGANRIHIVGANQTVTVSNATDLASGVLMETRLYRPDLTTAAMLTAAANEARRLLQPPVLTYNVTYKPGSALPYGWVNLGDTVTLNIADGLFTLSDSRRVVQITTRPRGDDGVEAVDLTFNLPADRLGT